MSLQYVGTGRLGKHQSVACTTTTAGTIATGVTNGAQKVRVLVTTDSFIRTDGTTATSNDVYLPALSQEYFSVTAGQTVSAISVSAAGTLHVTEVS